MCIGLGMYGGQDNWGWGGNAQWNSQNQGSGWGMSQQSGSDSKVN